MQQKEQQQIIAIGIFTISVLSLGKGLGNLDNGIGILDGFIIATGAIGAIISIYLFLKAKK
jgi:hypothetical protein